MATRVDLTASFLLSDDGRPPSRRQQIIAAAYDLLEEEGLDGLTIRAVLKRTGLARRAFYERFAGKDDLVLAVFEETLAAGAKFYRERCRALPDPLARIEMIVVGLLLDAIGNEDGIGERGVVAMVHEHLRLALTRPAELQAALKAFLDLIAEQVTEGIRMGQLRDCDPVLEAALMFNLVATTLHTELLTQGAGEPHYQRREGLGGEIWEFCRRAIIA